MINYELAKQQGPKLKAALTRAQKKDYPAVQQACKDAVTAWNIWGAWPDNWSRWQRALDDAAVKHNHNLTGIFAPHVHPIRLEDL